MATDRTVTTPYQGARVTRLVNRVDILEQIETAVRDRSGHTYVFYIEADGGMGKTFLAREVLRRCRKKGEWAAPDLLAARHEVDLYHHQARSREGFMAAFVKALGAGNRFFAAYRRQSRRLQTVKDDLHGAIAELKKEQELLAHYFLEGCEELQEKKTVVVLDTTEKLQYQTDPIQQALGLGKETFDLRNWLLEEEGWLSHMHNAVILVCGRPNEEFAADLETAASACPDTHFRGPKNGLELCDFDETETLEYIAAVEETASQDRNRQALKRLQAIPPDSRRAIHLLTGGRPITLALIVDYYLVTERLLPAVKVPLADLQALPDEKKSAIRDQVKDDVMRLFKEIGRPADDALLYLAWAPMGMDAELLSRVGDLELSKAQRVLEALADPRTGLSFVKIRQDDKRAFLHDEMYALIREHILKMEQPRAQDVYGRILEYYADKIDAQLEKIKTLYAQLRAKATPGARKAIIPLGGSRADPRALADARAELDDLRVEQVYYLLRRDPLKGFAQYCEYAEAAIMDRNDNLDVQLRDEIFRFVQEAAKEGYDLKGLRPDAVERDSALRWGWRSVYANRPDEGYKLVQFLRREQRDFMDRGGALAWAELDIIEGWVAGFRGSGLQKSEARLAAAVNTLKRLVPQTDFERLRRDILLAQAHSVLGYLLRVQGRYQAACDTYRCALPLWRKREREADHAETLNNLAWAYAEAGNYRRAIRSCHNGLELREKLGYRYLIALSYNTLGAIEVKHDQPHRGLAHCEQALSIFRNLNASRGVGLACTALAEAYRRSADLEHLYPPAEKAKRLGLSEKYAADAVQIFHGEVPEPLRLVEALNELGCTYRNRARMRDKDDPERERLIEQSSKTLTDAARLARKEFAYRQVDASVNLAWLYFYAEKPDEQIEEVLHKATEIIPAHYRIAIEKGPPHVSNPITFFWVQLSKIHVLRGEMAMHDYWDKPSVKGKVRDPALLQQAVEHFTLALAYGELFSDDYRDIRRAKDTIYAQFRRANVEELRAIYETVKITAVKYDLDYCPARPDLPGRLGERARPRMRNFLEENFGTLEELREERTCAQP